MKLSLDSKPLGAFIEYTLKPIIEESHDLLNLMKDHDLKAGYLVEKAFKLYIIDCTVRTLTTIVCTGLVCYTALLCLSMKT